MKLKLVKSTDSRLRQVSEPVTKFNSKLRSFAADLHELMIKEKGIGISAIQVGENIQLLIVGTKIHPHSATATIMVNPQCVEALGSQRLVEGCLSFPGLQVPVTRPACIHVKYKDVWGKSHETILEGLAAAVWSHEKDHLLGTTLEAYVNDEYRNQSVSM